MQLLKINVTKTQLNELNKLSMAQNLVEWYERLADITETPVSWLKRMLDDSRHWLYDELTPSREAEIRSTMKQYKCNGVVFVHSSRACSGLMELLDD